MRFSDDNWIELQRFAHWIRIAVLAAILPSNGSSTWNTEAVLASGGADATATTTDSPRRTTARPTASNRKAFVCSIVHTLHFNSSKITDWLFYYDYFRCLLFASSVWSLRRQLPVVVSRHFDRLLSTIPLRRMSRQQQPFRHQRGMR